MLTWIGEAFRVTGKPGDGILVSLHITEAAMQVGKWGNSLAARLPASVVELLE